MNMKVIKEKKMLLVLLAAVICFVAPLIVVSVGSSNAAVSAGTLGTPSTMDIFVDESLLVYLPEFPNATYSAGVGIVRSDSSYDSLDPASVKWSSSNEKVLVVDRSGNIKPTGIGTAVITAGYNGVAAQKTVAVKKGDITALVPVKDDRSYFFTKETTIDDLFNEEMGLHARASNGRLFEVERDAVAYGCESVTITASWNGLATDITFAAVDTSNFHLEASLSPVTLKLYETVETRIFAVSGQNRADVTDLVSWSVKDEPIAKADKRFITGMKEGKTEILAEFAGQSVSMPVTVASE